MGKRGGVVGTATDDETAELVILEVVLGLSDGVMEIAWRAVDGDVEPKVRGKHQRSVAGAERGGDGPKRKNAVKETKSKQETESH